MNQSPTNVYGIQATPQDDGSLLIEADDEARETIRSMYVEGRGYYAVEALVVEALRDQAVADQVMPEWIGALTEAPIFADSLDYPDDGNPQLFPESKVWWFPSYAIIDPWEELASSGSVSFLPAPTA